MALRFQIIQHEVFEEPGCVIEWILKNEDQYQITHLYLDEQLPEHAAYEVLVVMGGPMGVYDDAKYHWLKREKAFIKEAISRHKKIIGICLGSQLLASVLGAKVYPNSEKEIGFFPILRTTHTSGIFAHFPDETTVFHWHGDTFDLPENACLQLSSEVCKNQAFTVGSNILGLQCHFEATTQLIEGFLTHGSSEMVDAPHIQTYEQIRALYSVLPTSNLLLNIVLDNFIATQ